LTTVLLAIRQRDSEGTMKLQPDKFDVQSISGYGPGWIGVDGQKITHSVIISSGGERIDWPPMRFEDLSATHFAQLALVEAEIVIFGSGSRLRFPNPSWLRPLIARRVGVETMDTAAACRTYNILAQEGRSVAVALLLEQPGGLLRGG
jgi:uncharacterized protein